MPYCSNCGSQLDNGAAFCSICGAPVAQQDTAQQSAAPVSPAAGSNVYVPVDEQTDIKNNKLYAVLAYFGILVLVPIFAAPKSKFARFHANQGLLLCCVYGAEIIVTILLNLIKVDMVRFIWGVPYYYRGSPWYVTLICTLLWLAVAALAIIGAINAGTGKYKKLPVVGELFTFLK